MRKKPWNIIDVPVYSLATYCREKINMNICTYVTPVSMKPKLYAIGVYDGTQSQKNILESETVILQLLAKTQIQYVKYLGMKSGLKFDKNEWLKKKNRLTVWGQFQVLEGAAAYIELKKLQYLQTGDHLLCIMEAISQKTNHADVLTLNDLREKGIIRI
jgi:flavin reductase (DIM6/NTAB) family NADH-FMN oxidoreductase RutF